jgi:metal-dependent hydrolase (beta-lactamase superfamily II)
MDLTPEQIQQMIVMLQSMLPSKEETNNPKDDPSNDEFVSTIKTKKVSAKKSNFKNKFNNMAERNMHKEDVEIDKRLIVNGPTPRRKTNSLTEVQCRVCGKKDTVNANMLVDKTRYKCNSCASGAG